MYGITKLPPLIWNRKDYLQEIHLKNTCICHSLGKKPIAKLSDPVSRGIQEARYVNKPRIISFRKDGKAKELYLGYDPNDSRTYFNQAFVECLEIGHGSFGTVHSATYLGDGKKYAIKKAHHLYLGEKNRKAAIHEVKIQEGLPHHPNIVSFFKAWEEADRLYIQLELCGRYSLSDIRTCSACVNTNSLWVWLEDMTKAIKFLHDHQIIHLDVKPDNMFLAKNGHSKLGDFGLALDVNTDNLKDCDDGDSRYLAPEILNNSPTKAADIYSLGMSFIHLAVNDGISLKSTEMDEICERLKNSTVSIQSKYFKKVKDVHFLKLLSLLINKNPLKRPDAHQVLDAIRSHRRNSNFSSMFLDPESKRINSNFAIFVFIFSLFCMFLYHYLF